MIPVTPFDFSKSAKRLLESGEETIYSTALARSTSEGLCSVAESLGWICVRRQMRLDHKAFRRLLVVGVATWAPEELKLLDQLAAASPEFTVALFDVDQIETQEAVGDLLPGAMGFFMKTPYVGDYEQGIGTVLQGADAVRRVKEIVGERR